MERICVRGGRNGMGEKELTKMVTRMWDYNIQFSFVTIIIVVLHVSYLIVLKGRVPLSVFQKGPANNLKFPEIMMNSNLFKYLKTKVSEGNNLCFWN